jgi:hypothetical protein
MRKRRGMQLVPAIGPMCREERNGHRHRVARAPNGGRNEDSMLGPLTLAKTLLLQLHQNGERLDDQ